MATSEKVRQMLDSYNKNGYLNGSILVASKGNILENKGFGYANIEHAIPNSKSTKYRIGSLSKAFTAYAIFQLLDRGKLNINDMISKYIDNYPVGENISIYHCLTNTSGIPNYTSFRDFWSSTMRLPSSLKQLIDTFKDQPLNFKPGEQFEYSNSGYAILTAIIEQVSGLSYSNYMREEIFIPFGMKNTGCDDGRKIIPELASGYSLWEETIHAEYTDMSFPLGSYGLYSTTEDLYIWDQTLKNSNLLNDNLMTKMFTPHYSSYASGWVVSEILSRKCIHHFGDLSGYCSSFLRFIDEEVTVIFLSNLNITPVSHLTKEVAKVVFDEEVTLPRPLESIQLKNPPKIVGEYQFENDQSKKVHISEKLNELYLIAPKMYGVLYKYRLIPVEQELYKITFLTEYINEKVILHYSRTSGEIDYMQYIDLYGEEYICYRIEF
ncbi:serine hydrolase [Lysinibacillus sp. 2017]|uniref:serine hydrolase domain-containing protein n=1 Tax=unclassified Lysinibacillus TaxID=2636778 RepID=UPI000D5277F9|nr:MULTISPECIES: serine hydrolase domain-containing protein [unclassified Lysinibacillus]AWE07325.1 serine hydrolase [Lysinibacillus sp. 2017]TGN32050.1 class A beta-lactamase-related serine hydrolase [Lysinibacillus sp. S2017]